MPNSIVTKPYQHDISDGIPMVPSSGNPQIGVIPVGNIDGTPISGGGGGASGVADKSTFVPGTTLEQPAGGIFQTTPDTLTNNQTGAMLLDANRAQVVTQKSAVLGSGTLQSAAGATGNGTSLTVTGYSAAILTVSGTFVGTITFEGTEDGTNWSSLSAIQLGTTTISTTATAPGVFEMATSGLASVRARISAWTSGAITVTGHASPVAYNGKVVNSVGNVSSGATDAGNPVKVGGVYNSTAPTLTTGQRGDSQLDTNGNLKITSATAIAGEDTTANKLVTEQRYSNFNISTATTTTVKSGAGYLDELLVAGGTMGNVTVYDNTAASGTVLLPAVTPVSGGILLKHITFSTGLTIVTAAATVLSGGYR